MLPSANYTPAHEGESHYFSAFRPAHWHWLLSGSWGLLRWVLSCFSYPAPGVSLWQYLIRHPWVSAPHPRLSPVAEAKMWPLLPLQLQLKLSRQLRNFQNSVLILNLSVLPRQLCSFHLESQNKCQRNTHTWEGINSGRFIKPAWPPRADERCP